MLRVGLTGGIACGKSAVADAFADRGVPVIDTDLLAREVVAPGTVGLEAVVAAFGPGICLPSGELDRRALRKRVFEDAASRRQLEDILHPLILEATLEKSAGAGGPYQLLVVPLLVETGFRDHVDRVLVVDCPPELQVERLVRRDAIDRETAQRMIASQAERDARLAAADDLILNDDDIAHLDRAVAALHERYLALAPDDAGHRS